MLSTPIHFPVSLRSFLALVLLVIAAGCGSNSTPAAATLAPGVPTQAKTAVVAATTVAPTPTITPEPQAVRIDQDGITVAEYQAEQAQLQEALQSLGKTLTPEEQRQQVLDNLTDTLLLAQGAVENGFQADDAAVQKAIDALGDAKAVQDWMSQRGYTEDTFRAALRRQMAAAWMRDKIAAEVPETAEQIHIRQILTTDPDIANQALEQVKLPGSNFAAYSYQYDLATGGDLGWFPRGYLIQPEVEEAAFQLQPGEISPVIHSSVGYHILQMISREPARLVSPDARRVLQHKALQDWLKTRMEGHKVEILLP